MPKKPVTEPNDAATESQNHWQSGCEVHKPPPLHQNHNMCSPLSSDFVAEFMNIHDNPKGHWHQVAWRLGARLCCLRSYANVLLMLSAHCTFKLSWQSSRCFSLAPRCPCNAVFPKKCSATRTFLRGADFGWFLFHAGWPWAVSKVWCISWGTFTCLKKLRGLLRKKPTTRYCLVLSSGSGFG